MRGKPGSDAVLLDLVGEVMALLDMDELRRGLLAALLRIVPARYASINELEGGRPTNNFVDPPIDDDWYVKFAELAHENPIYRLHVDTRDGRAYRFCDVTTREELEATRLYREVYHPLGIEYQIAFTLPSDAGRLLAVVLHRSDGDFSDSERDFLNRARPFLIQTYRNALAFESQRHDGAPAASDLERGLVDAGLSARQAQIAALVAIGRSTNDIATELALSARTVQKHLEPAYRKLGVTSRSAAAARAWELAAG